MYLMMYALSGFGTGVNSEAEAGLARRFGYIERSMGVTRPIGFGIHFHLHSVCCHLVCPASALASLPAPSSWCWAQM